VSASGLASSEAGLFPLFGEYSYAQETGFQNNFKVNCASTIELETCFLL
jgi:hypothetical protein